MRDIEQKISPLVQNMFPSFYREEGQNFIAFVEAYYEWLETNFQLLELEDTTNFNVGDKVTQQDVTGTIVSYVDKEILVQIDGFNTFKCYNVCSELIPITSSSGGNTFILTGGNTKRLSPLYMSRNLSKLRDIDKTLDLFIVNFKEKYLKNIEFDTLSNKQLLVKNSLDLYRSKGTERSIDLFFRLVYGIKADVDYPGERLFTLSAGEWYKPVYLEVTSESVSRNIELVGKQITGVISGATAFVEKYIKRKVSSGFVHLLYISNIKGEFVPKELLKSDVAYNDSPKVLGSLTSAFVTFGGMGYKIGDIVAIQSPTGDKALATVTSVKDKSGTVDFELIDSGWGYTVSANNITPYSVTDRTQTLVTDKMFTLSNIETGNTVQSISVVNPGFFYSNTDTIRVVSPTVNATARIITSGSLISQVIVTNPGSGFFTTTPTIEILTSTGSVITDGGATFSLAFEEPRKYFNLFDTVSQTNASGTLIYSADNGVISLASISGELRVGDVIYQTGPYGERGSARITQIISSALSAADVKVDQISGVFLKNDTVYVLNRPITAEFKNISLVVGVSKISNSYTQSADMYFKYAGTKAKFEIQSTGDDAQYEIGSITNTDTAYLNTDLLSANNNLGIPFLSLPINEFSYGFPKNIEGNINNIIFSTLQYEPFTLGSIATLADLNPGQNYSTDPKTVTYQPYLASENAKDYIIQIKDLTRSLAVDEMISQQYDEPRFGLTLTPRINPSVGEKLQTSSGTGIVQSVNLSANQVILKSVTGTMSPSQSLSSFSDGNLSATISQFNNFQEGVIAKALVKSANSTIIHAKRIQYENLFKPNELIVGSRGGASANVVSIRSDDSVNPIGFNGVVNLVADSTEGAVASLNVTDSGFGYQENQPLVFTSETNPSIGNALAGTEGIGVGAGYYKTSKGFLSSLSKLHDGDFYQEYSYEVFSRIPIDKYAEMFKKVMHTAGTRFFGSVLIDSIIDANVGSATSATTITNETPFVITDRFTLDVEDRTNIQVEIRE
jgi:hypothetical protein